MQTPEDQRLVERLRAGEEGAVAELERRFGARIAQLAFRQLRNREDAQEVVQDVLLKVSRKIHAFRGDSALSSWIYRITFNASMSRLRVGKARRTRESGAGRLSSGDSTHQPVEADWSRLPDEALLRAELRQSLSTALLEIPEIYRTPIVLRDIEGLSTEEAGRRLALKDQTLKSRLHRGRRMLRKKLAAFDRGLTLHVRPSTVETLDEPGSRLKAA